MMWWDEYFYEDDECCCKHSPFEKLLAKYKQEGLTFDEARTKVGEVMNWHNYGE